MSITAILMGAIALIAAIFGGSIGHRFGKSSGVKEGVQKQAEAQAIEQAKAAVKAVQERAHVDQVVAGDSDSALNDRLSRYDRAE